MKYLTKSSNFLKRRRALKILGLLSLSPALSDLGISSMKDVKEIYDNITVKSKENTEEFQYTYSGKIELSPLLPAQIEEYLK